MKPRNYQCRKCGKINQITTPWGMFIIPHLGWHKWLKCECGVKRHFQRRVFQPEMEVKEALEDTLIMVDEAVEMGRAEVEKRERVLDEAYSMIDNLRDNICELKSEKTELVRKFERLIYDTQLKDVFEEIEDAMMNNHTLDLDSDYPMPHYYEELKEDMDAIKKKYGVED